MTIQTPIAYEYPAYKPQASIETLILLNIIQQMGEWDEDPWVLDPGDFPGHIATARDRRLGEVDLAYRIVHALTDHYNIEVKRSDRLYD